MDEEVSDLYKRLLLTAEEVGLYPINDDFYCKLLATLYVHGSEVMVLDSRISADLLVAQKRLNLFGGELPKAELVPVVRQYIKELEECEHPEWLIALEKHYGVKLMLTINGGKKEKSNPGINEQQL